MLPLQRLCLLSPRTICMSRLGSDAAMDLAHKLVLTLLVQNTNPLNYLSKILAKAWDLSSAWMWHFLTCSLRAVQGFLGCLEEDKEKMVGAVERQLDQRQVISIRTGCLSTAFPWLALRGGSLLCLHQASWVRGSLCIGHKLNMHRQEPSPATAATSKMPLEIPKTLLAKHEIGMTGGRWAGN